MDASNRMGAQARRARHDNRGTEGVPGRRERASHIDLQMIVQLTPDTLVCVVKRRTQKAALLNTADTRHVLTIDPGLQEQLRDVLEEIARTHIRTDDEASGYQCGLTRRQLEIVRMVKDGASNKVIARDLGLSVGTVKVHMHRIFRALGIENRVQLAMLDIAS